MHTQDIEGRQRDLGGFSVRRVLPAVERRTLGAFVFLDHMGPHTFGPGAGMDVRPHPHIGLSTLTYLYSGEILHRDSLGVEQPIRPGEVNWMTAGRGVVHSERTAAAARSGGMRLHGLQFWVALPAAAEEIEPSFVHHDGDTLPELERDGARLRLIAGAAFDRLGPVRPYSPLLFVDVTLRPGGVAQVPEGYAERGVYVAEGRVRVGDRVAEEGHLLVLPTDPALCVEAEGEARVAILGGEPLAEPRYLFWNFVSSRPERIEQAAADWRARRFPLVPGDEVEFTPAPEGPPPFARR